MSSLNKRLSDLERRTTPKRPRAFVVLKDGQYSQAGQPLTAEEYIHLKEVCDVELFEVVYTSKDHDHD